MISAVTRIRDRFRGFLPVVVDVETAGFDPRRDALLELAAIPLEMDECGILHRGTLHACHIAPFPGANLDASALKFNGIDPHHPFRNALSETAALESILGPIRESVKRAGCSKAILVGHNPAFDLAFLNAAIERTGYKKSPFHSFSTFDTATLGGLVYGQTVLAKAALCAGIPWDNEEAHSAIYDTERTADLFCMMVNRWRELELREFT
jgi:ribonuclease T